MLNKFSKKFALLMGSVGSALPMSAALATNNDPFGINNVNTRLKNRNLIAFIQALVNWILGFLALIVFFIILFAGFQWMTAGGDGDKVGKAKTRIINAVIGLVVIFLAWAIVNFVISALSETGDISG